MRAVAAINKENDPHSRPNTSIWFKSVAAGLASVFTVLLLAIAWLLLQVSRIPHAPNTTIGFSPVQLFSQPPVLAATALVFLLGLGVAQFSLRRRRRS